MYKSSKFSAKMRDPPKRRLRVRIATRPQRQAGFISRRSTSHEGTYSKQERRNQSLLGTTSLINEITAHIYICAAQPHETTRFPITHPGLLINLGIREPNRSCVIVAHAAREDPPGCVLDQSEGVATAVETETRAVPQFAG